MKLSRHLRHSRNVDNTRLWLVFSTFPPCSQMPVVFYHSVIHGLRSRLLSFAHEIVETFKIVISAIAFYSPKNCRFLCFTYIERHAIINKIVYFVSLGVHQSNQPLVFLKRRENKKDSQQLVDCCLSFYLVAKNWFTM